MVVKDFEPRERVSVDEITVLHRICGFGNIRNILSGIIPVMFSDVFLDRHGTIVRFLYQIFKILGYVFGQRYPLFRAQSGPFKQISINHAAIHAAFTPYRVIERLAVFVVAVRNSETVTFGEQGKAGCGVFPSVFKKILFPKHGVFGVFHNAFLKIGLVEIVHNVNGTALL